MVLATEGGVPIGANQQPKSFRHPEFPRRLAPEQTRNMKMRATLFATVAVVGLALSVPAFADASDAPDVEAFTVTAMPASQTADAGDYVVTNRQTADAGDYVVTNRQTADAGDYVVTNRQTADAGDYVVTNRQTADAGDYVVTNRAA
jgi:hypothetical protein